jgi:hypothetical protein
MRHLFVCFVLLMSTVVSAVAADTTEVVTTARKVAEAAAEKKTAAASVDYLVKTIPSLSIPAEQRAAYAFLAAIQEQLGRYQDAGSSYAAAAAIAAGDADGMPGKSSEQLVLDAVRCALSSGDSDTADRYLNSAVRNSADVNIIAYVKLYEQWSALCRASDEAALQEPVVILKAYSDLASMKTVRPILLLTLWHITGDTVYADRLKKEFPASPETAIVSGDIQLLPAPFWYFAPRTGTAQPDIAPEPVTLAGDQSSETADAAAPQPVRQQLGLFREQVNAASFVTQLNRKGFAAYITTEKRPSGTVYYLVVVDENKNHTIGDELRTAGFECYPVFN